MNNTTGVLKRLSKAIFLIAVVAGSYLVLPAKIALADLSLDIAQSNLDLGSVAIGNGNNFQGSLGLITVSDDRNGSPGWTLTAAATHMTTIRPSIRVTGNSGDVTSAGVYDGMLGIQSPNATYNITINQGGSVGTATFDVSGAETMNNVVTGSFVAIGTRGARVNFDVGTYTTGDKWIIIVDTLPYTDITITPGNITVNSGSGTGVSTGNAGAFEGTASQSDNKIIMQASSGNGTGSYSITPGISVNIHTGPMAGTYTGDILFTIS
ncbi:MAG: hypothetical protein AAB551_01055 [Patescibacteria group bacterium]